MLALGHFTEFDVIVVLVEPFHASLDRFVVGGNGIVLGGDLHRAEIHLDRAGWTCHEEKVLFFLCGFELPVVRHDDGEDWLVHSGVGDQCPRVCDLSAKRERASQGNETK